MELSRREESVLRFPMQRPEFETTKEGCVALTGSRDHARASGRALHAQREDPHLSSDPPPDLASIDALKLEGLQLADGQPVAALFRFRTTNREHLSGFYWRADAVPLQAKPQT